MQGYQDANDVFHLQHDPLYKDILEADLASQPSISRFENSLDKHSIFALCYAWIDRYVCSLQGRKHIIIDIDATMMLPMANSNSQCSMIFTVSLCITNCFSRWRYWANHSACIASW